MGRRSSTGTPGIEKIAKGRFAGRYRLHVRHRDAAGRIVEVYRMLPVDTKITHAKRALEALQTEVRTGEVRPRSRTVDHAPAGVPTTLRQAFDVYLGWVEEHRPKTHASRGFTANVWCRVLGADFLLRDLTGLRVKAFQKARLAEGVQGPTVNREIAMVKHMVGLATREGWGWPLGPLHVTQVRAIEPRPENPPRERYLSDDERTRLLAEAHGEIAPIVLTAIHTGMRQGEILALRKPDVDLAASTIRVRTSKNGKPRRVPINATLHPVLRASMDASPGDLVFARSEDRPTARRRTKSGEPWTKDAVTKVYASVLRRAEITDFTFHDLRHEHATRRLRAGVPVHVLAAYLGHDAAMLLKRYAHVLPDQIHAAAALPDVSVTIATRDPSARSVLGTAKR